jgi:hypothetical protein
MQTFEMLKVAFGVQAMQEHMFLSGFPTSKTL